MSVRGHVLSKLKNIVNITDMIFSSVTILVPYFEVYYLKFSLNQHDMHIKKIPQVTFYQIKKGQP